MCYKLWLEVVWATFWVWKIDLYCSILCFYIHSTIIFVHVCFAGENGSISILPLYMVDAGEAKTRVAFYTGVMGSFTTIAGSLVGGAILKKLVMYIKVTFDFIVLMYYCYRKVLYKR